MHVSAKACQPYIYTPHIAQWSPPGIDCFIGTHTITTERALLSQSPQINTYVCIISRLLVTITWCRFSRLHNLHFAFIDKFHPSYNTKSYNFRAPTFVTPASHKITAKNALFFARNHCFWRRNNFMSYISFWRRAMFAPWRSQNPVRIT